MKAEQGGQFSSSDSSFVQNNGQELRSDPSGTGQSERKKFDNRGQRCLSSLSQERSLEEKLSTCGIRVKTQRFLCHCVLQVMLYALWKTRCGHAKSETELTASVLRKKKIQNTQEIKRTLFN